MDLITDCKQIDIEDTCPLRVLVDILEKFPQRFSSNILEITFLKDFPLDIVLHPIENFSPRWIIEYMITIHGNCMNMILEKPDLLETFVYKYNSNDKVKEYVFSNNMMFYVDIITLCFLYHIEEISCKFEKLQLIQNLVVIMNKKYYICTDTNISNPKNVTLKRIAHSFPSVTYDMLYHNNINTFMYPSAAFPDFYLPNTFCSPWIASVIPMLDCNYDNIIPLLTACAVLLDGDNRFKTFKNTSLYQLYQNIVKLNISKIYPTTLKLTLCQRWGIINMIEDDYRFASNLIIACERAKILISVLRCDDPDLNNVLSNL